MRGTAARPRGIALALAGGGPFGATYEIGALIAIEEAIEGLALTRLDCYVGVSAGSFIAAALANGIPVREIHRLFIEGGPGEGALTPELFMRPAFAEYRRRARSLPTLVAAGAWRYLRKPSRAGALDSIFALGRALPAGLFDNEGIHRYLARIFDRPGRTNDFRGLRAPLYLVATDLDSGRSVSFGRPGHDAVPISKAVQASAALPGLFPPVVIDGHHFVDGALRKTLHASEALDDGAQLVVCVNPIVPFDSRLAAATGRGPASRLAEGGLPVVLSQTFRAVIHSRMATGLASYRRQYPTADVMLFQPEPDDGRIFFTNIFGYAMREALCQHAYERTRRDLLQRQASLAPILARHGLRLRVEALRAPARRLGAGSTAATLREAAGELGEAMQALKGWVAGEEGHRAA